MIELNEMCEMGRFRGNVLSPVLSSDLSPNLATHEAFLRGAVALGLEVVAQEERGHRASRAGHEEHAPDLEQDVQDAPAGGQRVLQRRGYGQQLYRREVERVEDRLDLGARSIPLQEVDRDRADECH